MINSFSQFLVEEEKTLYFTFGRMNPPTTGHEKLLTTLAKKAGKNPYRIFLSRSEDKEKNPLAYKAKVKFARKAFPKHARSIVMSGPNTRNVMEVASAIYDEGFKNAVMVVGSDRIKEFDLRLNAVNGKKGRHGFFNFEKITVISAGDRDPDAEGTSGMSASKMRSAASENDFTTFSQGLPKAVKNADAKAIYNAVRKGMGLKEQNVYENHIQLETVSETREAYVKGQLFEVGDTVVIKSTDEVAEVKVLGTNYVIVESAGKTTRKWLDAIELLEKTDSPQDPDIKDKEGTQPKAYFKGLGKGTKDKRDSHFKKNAKKADDDPSAYKPAPGDKTAKTKPSKHTKKFKQMFGDD